MSVTQHRRLFPSSQKLPSVEDPIVANFCLLRRAREKDPSIKPRRLGVQDTLAVELDQRPAVAGRARRDFRAVEDLGREPEMGEAAAGPLGSAAGSEGPGGGERVTDVRDLVGLGLEDQAVGAAGGAEQLFLGAGRWEGRFVGGGLALDDDLPDSGGPGLRWCAAAGDSGVDGAR